MSNEGKWVLDLKPDGIWDCDVEFETREEAIAYGKKNFEELYEEEHGEIFNSENYKKVFYVGQIERFVPSVSADSVVEQIAENAYDEVGELAEDYLSHVSIKELVVLEEKFNKVLKEWMDETKNNPTFFKITNTEEINV